MLGVVSPLESEFILPPPSQPESEQFSDNIVSFQAVNIVPYSNGNEYFFLLSET